MRDAAHIALRAALLPVLVAQALQVRRRALRLPEAAGPRQGVTGTGPDLRLLVLGDSSAAGVGADTQDAALLGQLVARLAPDFTVAWRLEARTGRTTHGTLREMAALGDAQFDVAVVALGVNDVTRGKTLRGWLRDTKRLVARLQERHGARHVYLSGLPPMGLFPLLPQPLRWVLGRQAARFDTALRRALHRPPLCAVTSFEVDLNPELMAPDGFHPAPRAYAIWADRIAALIRADLPSQRPARGADRSRDGRSPARRPA
jgi:lysophospholipase L1-like esterase